MTEHNPSAQTNIIFLGNEQLAQGLDRAICPSFEALIRHGYHIVALVLPSQKFRKTPHIIKVAQSQQIPIHFIEKSREIIPLISQYQAQLGILASFGKIIPEDVISAFPLGILNLHPSLLPKYRGTTPIETALLNDDSRTGISIMGLTKDMDAGPIYAQKTIRIDRNTSKQALYEQLATIGSQLLITILPQYLDHHIKSISQDASQASFTKPLNKSDGSLNPSQYSAMELANQVRAYLNFPKSKTTLLGTNCTITKAHSSNSPSTELDLLCNDGNYLVIDQLRPDNGKTMTAAAFINGKKNRRPWQHDDFSN